MVVEIPGDTIRVLEIPLDMLKILGDTRGAITQVRIIIIFEMMMIWQYGSE